MNFFANVTSEKIDLIGPVQTPEFAAMVVSEMLGRDLADVQVHMTRMGGGFGRRLYGDFVYEAAEISNTIKKPVKVVSTREDDMTTGVYRPAIKYRIAASIKNNKITGYHLKEAAVDGNMYGLIPHFFPAGCIPNYKVSTGNYKSDKWYATANIFYVNERKDGLYSAVFPANLSGTETITLSAVYSLSCVLTIIFSPG